MRRVSRRDFLGASGEALAAVPALAESSARTGGEPRPNIIFIMADDMGYGDAGCYGQTKIQTPCIDALADEGMRFTQCYAGSPVCSPSRSALMTGQHTGHTRVRGNHCRAGGVVDPKKGKVRRMNLTDEDVTIGHVLRQAGYRTGVIGKWHLGGYEPEAHPLNRGFDEFYGPLTRTTTGGYFPHHRHQNLELVPVPENADKKEVLFHADLCTRKAIDFVSRHREDPFFLYLAFKVPHTPLVAPDLEPYTQESWPESEKTYAAMITRMDRCIGMLIAHLRELDIERNTIVFFCSDNGPRSESHSELTRVSEFFDSNGPLKGHKRDLYEGGIRVPMIAWWPGHVPAGVTSAVPWYFPDVLPTAAELAGVTPPANIDGVSVVPTLLGHEQDRSDRFLYWEFYERGFQQAVRWRNWKAIRSRAGCPLRLYNLADDPGEETDVASEHAEVVARIEQYLKTARTDSPNWPLRPRERVGEG